MSVIKVVEDNVDLIMQRINQVTSAFEGIADGKLSSLAGLPLIGEGVQKIKKNVGTIKKRTGNTSRIIAKQKGSFINGELLITGMFDAIEIPTELNNVYSPTGEVSNNIQVDKNDGTSVNNGVASNETKIDFNDNFERENVTNIVNDSVIVEQFEDNYQGDNVNLTNISNNNGIKLDNFDDITNVEKRNIDTVITNADTEQRELETNDNQLATVKIENINDNVATEQVELKTNDGQTMTRIGNINNSNSNAVITPNDFEINTDGTVSTRITNIYNQNNNAVIDENGLIRKGIPNNITLANLADNNTEEDSNKTINDN